MFATIDESGLPPHRGKVESYAINLSGGILSWAKLETRAKAEMRTRPGYVARVIVEALGR